MSDSTSRELRLYGALLTRLLDALPARSRAHYGAELAAVYEDILRDTHAQSGIGAVRRRLPGLVMDVGAALVLEYVDLWRRASCSPLRVAIVSLAATAFVWSLTLVAAAGRAEWVISVLEFNLATTVTLMLGLPVVSLVASRVSVGPGQSTDGHSVLYASIAVTTATWSVLLWHVAA